MTGSAVASLPGGNGGLTVSNGVKTIKWSNKTLTTAQTVKHAAWSPDGSRAVYVNANNEVLTVRFNDGFAIEPVTYPLENGETAPQRSSPTWQGGGSLIIMAEKSGSGGTWRLMEAITSYSALYPLTPDDGFHYLNPDAGPGWKYVYQKQANSGGSLTGTPEIWFAEGANKTQITTDAANPAISPDGNKVAFVRGGQIWSCTIADCDNSLVQITSNAGDKNDPTWSPAGSTIAFRTVSNNTAGTAAANGSQAASPDVTSLVGIPAYQTTKQNAVIRLAGANRFATAVATSKSYWGNGGANAVVLSRSDNFADALGGSALAAAKGGPLLLTAPSTLNPDTKAEIARVLGGDTSKTVYLLGGTAGISQAIQDEIAGMGYLVDRIAGADRYATSVAIANKIDTTPDLVLAATGANFPDALAAGAAAGSYNVPGSGSELTAVVILTKGNVATAPVASYLSSQSSKGAEVFGIGVQGYIAAANVLGASEVFGVAGANRYDTAAYVAWTFFGIENHVGLATGTNWPDALGGGALMAMLNGPLLLTPSGSTSLNGITAYHLDSMSGTVDTALIFGGTGVLSGALDAKIGAWISGPAGFSTGSTTVSAAPGTKSGAAGLAPSATTHKTLDQIKEAAQQLPTR